MSLGFTTSMVAPAEHLRYPAPVIEDAEEVKNWAHVISCKQRIFTSFNVLLDFANGSDGKHVLPEIST